MLRARVGRPLAAWAASSTPGGRPLAWGPRPLQQPWPAACRCRREAGGAGWLGSSSGVRGFASYSNPYATLGLQHGAGQKEVDAAYRKLAMRWHPDRNLDDKAAAERKFKAIGEAYESLSRGGAGASFGGMGSGSAPSGGSPGGGFPSGGFPGGGRVDPQMEAMLREMMRGVGSQLSGPGGLGRETGQILT